MMESEYQSNIFKAILVGVILGIVTGAAGVLAVFDSIQCK